MSRSCTTSASPAALRRTIQSGSCFWFCFFCFRLARLFRPVWGSSGGGKLRRSLQSRRSGKMSCVRKNNLSLLNTHTKKSDLKREVATRRIKWLMLRTHKKHTVVLISHLMRSQRSLIPYDSPKVTTPPIRRLLRPLRPLRYAETSDSTDGCKQNAKYAVTATRKAKSRLLLFLFYFHWRMKNDLKTAGIWDL